MAPWSDPEKSKKCLEECARLIDRARLAREGGPWLAFQDDQCLGWWLKRWEKPWENDGKTMEKRWENDGKILRWKKQWWFFWMTPQGLDGDLDQNFESLPKIDESQWRMGVFHCKLIAYYSWVMSELGANIPSTVGLWEASEFSSPNHGPVSWGMLLELELGLHWWIFLEVLNTGKNWRPPRCTCDSYMTIFSG